MRLPATLTLALLSFALVPSAALARPQLDAAASTPFETARIAVRTGVEDLTPSIAARLGLDVDGAEPLGIPGWSLVPLAEPGDVALVGAITAELADTGVFAAPVQADSLGGPFVATPDVLVRFAAGTAPERMQAVLRELSGVVGVESDFAGMERAFRLRTAGLDGFAVLALADDLLARDEVEIAEPDMIFSGRAAQDLPTDPMFVHSWGLDAAGTLGFAADIGLDAREAWTFTRGDPSVRVLVIDTGVDPSHPDLLQDPGIDTTGAGAAGADVLPCDNHGTWVAGCISGIADNGIGTCGIAPDCRTVSARCFVSRTQSPCTGAWNAQYSWTADALEFAVQQGIQVSNNSNIYGAASGIVSAKYQETRDVDGMVHFASAGNFGVIGLGYPSSLPSVMGIGSLGTDGDRSDFSSYGPGMEFLAPGSSILSTDRVGADGAAGDYAWVNGTSFASPYAASVAALALSRVPWLTPDEVEEALRRGCVDLGPPGYEILNGHGRLSAARVLERLVPGDRRPVLLGSTRARRGGRTCHGPAMSSDGSVVAFSSRSRHLVPGDTNGAEDVFVKDLVAGRIERVSVDSAGVEGNDDSSVADISADGRYVVFQSRATNLVAADLNGGWDVFRHDRVTGDTVRVNVSSQGAETTSFERRTEARVSADGSRVVFVSSDTALAPGALSGRPQVFLRDIVAGTTELVSVGLSGVEGNGGVRRVDISDDGTRIVFTSWSSDLVAADTNQANDVFLRDTTTGTTTLVGVDGQGGQYPRGGIFCRISGDGSTVSFITLSPVHPSDTNDQVDLVVRDLNLGTTFLPALTASGIGPGGSGRGELGQDGRIVAFVSSDPGLVAGDTNGVADVFLADRVSGTVERASLGSAGQQAQRTCTSPCMSADASTVGFVSRDDDLAPGDRADRWSDVYVFDRTAGTSALVSGGS